MRISRLNKRIITCFVEIIIICVMLFVSYYGFINGNLSSYAQIAENNGVYNNDLKVLYGRNNGDEVAILSTEDIIDVGTLSVNNPNNHIVTSLITLKIDANSIIDLSLLNIKINDKLISMDKFELIEGFYTLNIEKREIESNETIYYRVKFLGDAFYIDTNSFSYHFQVTESFYY